MPFEYVTIIGYLNSRQVKVHKDVSALQIPAVFFGFIIGYLNSRQVKVHKDVSALQIPAVFFRFVTKVY